MHYKRNEHDAPVDLKDNLLYRARILAKCEQDADFRNHVFVRCKQDPIWWIDTFCYTRNPRKPDFASLPFICYDFQVPTILKIQKSVRTGKDLLIEKSRDMGVSWISLYALLHMFLFEDGYDFKVGSWKEEFVDRSGDMDSLMEKLRFTLTRLPGWMLQNTEHQFPFMKCLHGKYANSIVGETASKHFGSGGRRSAILFDEFAKWDHQVARGAWTSSADITMCRVVVSTPAGAGNKYAMLASGQSDEKIEVITLHWTMHPEKGKDAYYVDTKTGEKHPIPTNERAFKIWQKNRGVVLPRRFGLKGGVVRSPWYDAECERRSDTDVAQELDIDYARSGAPFFDMYALNEQRAWEYMETSSIPQRVPYGKYITGDLVYIENKVKFRPKPEDLGGWLRVFELPEKDLVYGTGGDTAEGLPKGDYNAFIVRQALSGNTCATILSHDKPEDFAEKVWLTGKWYKEAKIAVENNNHGYTVNLELERKGCNLYYAKRDETAQGEVTTNKRGWSTNRTTRIMSLDQYAEEIRTKSYEIRDDRFISQCKTFVRPENKPAHPEADGDFKDDAVIASAICSIMLLEIESKVTSTVSDAKKVAMKNKLLKRKKFKVR